MVEIAYVRGSQISFIIVPDMFKKAPFFNRITMWRKFKGHAVYGAGTAAIAPRGNIFKWLLTTAAQIDFFM